MNLDGKTYTEKEREELHGATDTTVTPQTKVYNGFTAPAETEILINPDGSSVLEYKYTRNKYTFAVENTNDIDSEHSTPNDEYYYGTTIKAIAIDKDGYNFKKWSNEETSYTTSFTLVKDTVINPIYEAIEYQISYDLDDGNVSENPITYTIESDDIILNNPTKTEHQFIGWTGTDLDSITKNVTIPKGSIGDRSYLAHYTINQYTLTATNVDSSSTPNGTYDYGTPITLTAANLEGYTFKNWSNNLTTKTINFNLIEDTVIKAFYTGNKYTIVFNANGGTGTMSNQQMTYGTSTKLKANTFTRTEYVFDHWNTKADGTGTSYENQESVSNLATSGTVNLYVIWKEKTAEQNDFIEYDISYTDMYSDKSYTNTNAWKILDFTDNGDGTYSDVRLISTGVPAMLYYSYQSVNNEWWETDITKLNSFANILNTTIPTGGKYRLYSDYSNYPALMASAGLYESEKFETIKYKYGESFETWGNEEDYVNRGYFKNITNNNITYNESTSNVVTGADLFKVGNAEVRILTLPETNKLLNKTKNEFWGIVNNTTGTKIFDVLNLPYKGSYWLASPYHYISDGDEKFMVGISRTNLNRYDNNNSKSYNQGIRPIITLKGNFQLVDENKDGTWEIKE